MVIIMNKDLKNSLIYDKIELINDESSVYLDLSKSLKSGADAPVLIRIVGKIINQAEMLKQLLNEQED